MLVGSDQSCFYACRSCSRCEDKGRYARCASCNGRADPKRPAHPDDTCRCKEGVLAVRLANGRLIKRRFESNPFKGSVQTDAETQDERDWNSFIADKQNQMNNPNWNPIQIEGS